MGGTISQPMARHGYCMPDATMPPGKGWQGMVNGYNKRAIHELVPPGSRIADHLQHKRKKPPTKYGQLMQKARTMAGLGWFLCHTIYALSPIYRNLLISLPVYSRIPAIQTSNWLL